MLKAWSAQLQNSKGKLKRFCVLSRIPCGRLPGTFESWIQGPVEIEIGFNRDSRCLGHAPLALLDLASRPRWKFQSAQPDSTGTLGSWICSPGGQKQTQGCFRGAICSMYIYVYAKMMTIKNIRFCPIALHSDLRHSLSSKHFGPLCQAMKDKLEKVRAEIEGGPRP